MKNIQVSRVCRSRSNIIAPKKNEKDTAAELARAVLAVDAHLKSSSDESVHLWALVCLLRAAEASGAHLARIRRRGSAVNAGGAGGEANGVGLGTAATALLASAWRCAWDTLLRADLHFSHCTATCERGGTGEAVVAILGACLREDLLDPGFATKEQVRFFLRAHLDFAAHLEVVRFVFIAKNVLSSLHLSDSPSCLSVGSLLLLWCFFFVKEKSAVVTRYHRP